MTMTKNLPRARTEILEEIRRAHRTPGPFSDQPEVLDAVAFDASAVYSVGFVKRALGGELASRVLPACRVISGRVCGRALIQALWHVFGVDEAIEGAAAVSACQAPAHDRLLTVGEAAQKLGVSSRTLLRLVDAGMIAAVDLNSGKEGRRLLRFHAAAISDYIAEGYGCRADSVKGTA